MPWFRSFLTRDMRALFHRLVWVVALATMVGQVAAQPAPGQPAQGLTASSKPANDASKDAAVTGPAFAILEYEISGNTVLPVAQVEAAVLPFMGEGKRLDDVEKARDALEKAYQQAGFLTVFVDIPEQRVESGVVQLRVVEGRIERLRVTGARYFDQGVIRERVDQFAVGKVPNFNEAQRQLAAINRDERQVQPVLRPGLTPGTVAMELKVTDQLPLSGAVELNNRHAAQTDDWRLQASLRYDNLFQREHGLALTAITAPLAPSQSKVLSANYTVPADDGASWVLYAVWSDSVVEPLGATTVFGRGNTVGARWVRGRVLGDASHTISLGADYKDLKERVVSGSDTLDTPLRYLPLSASWNAAWRDKAGQGSLASTLTLGLRGLLARRIDCPGVSYPVDQFACKREGADGSFVHWRNDLRLTYRMSDLGTRLPGSLTGRLGWQLAHQPLASSEQYAIGGADSVRGYLEAEATGDQGVLASLEWRSPNLAGWLTGRPTGAAAGAAAGAANAPAPQLADLSLLAFLDLAQTRVLEPAAGQAARSRLAGVGLGLRLRMVNRMDAELDLAWPQRSTTNTSTEQVRVHFRLQAPF